MKKILLALALLLAAVPAFAGEGVKRLAFVSSTMAELLPCG